MENCTTDLDIKAFNHTRMVFNHTRMMPMHGSLFYTIVFKLHLYIHPVLCITGVIENTISVVIFCSKSLRMVSSNVYLAALSATSSLFCAANFVVWLETVDVGFFHQDVVCQTIIYSTYICSFLTVWFVVCITFENFLITVNIKCAVTVCTVKKARIMVCILTGLAFALYTFSLWTTNVMHIGGSDHCAYEIKFEQVLHIFTYIDITITSVLPFVSMVIFLGAIYVKLILKRVSKQPIATYHQPRRCRRNSKRTYQMLTRITRVLLAIGLTFTVFSFPTSVNKIRILVSNRPTPSFLHVEWAINQLCLIIYYCSFCIYFFIYLRFSTNYKKVLLRYVCK